LGTLLAVRFFFGAGEAGAYPNVARILSRWFPDQERGRAQGVLLTSALVGGAVAPSLAAQLIDRIGWRWTFAFFGSIGALWAAGFWWWFRDDPAEHAAVSPAEVKHIGRRATASAVHTAIPWASVARNPSIWCLAIVMALASFNSYIYFSWFPKYLQSGRGVGQNESGPMASLVLALGALGTVCGGEILDRLSRMRSALVWRRWFGGSGFAAAAALLGFALLTKQPWPAVIVTGLSSFATQATLPLWWSCAIGISGRHVGALFGLMNSVGLLGALSSQYLVGAMADALGARGFSGRAQWDPIFWIDIAVLVAAAVLWASFRFVSVEEPKQPIFEE
jgi:MFS family permease